jgi:hypothetical protein
MFPSLELLGRRPTIIMADIIFIIGAVLCTVPTHQLGLVYAGRLLTGLGVGGIAAVCPLYIAEISPPAIRGRLTGFFESSYQIGSVIGFWINYGEGRPKHDVHGSTTDDRFIQASYTTSPRNHQVHGASQWPSSLFQPACSPSASRS